MTTKQVIRIEQIPELIGQKKKEEAPEKESNAKKLMLIGTGIMLGGWAICKLARKFLGP